MFYVVIRLIRLIQVDHLSDKCMGNLSIRARKVLVYNSHNLLFFNIMHNNLIPSICFLIRGNVVQLQWPIIILMLC